MLDIQRLRVFRSVMASGSVVAAADNLGMTSSAVSQHLSALRDETGLVLFERVGRGLVPTAAARVIEQQSGDIMAQLAALDNVVADLKAGRTGRVTIGHFSSAGVHLMPQLARRLVDEMPDLVIDFVVTETGTHGMKVDLDVTLDPADGTPLDRPGYRRVELARDPFVAVTRAAHPFAKLKEVPLIAFADETLISNDQQRSIGHRIVVSACVAAGFTPRFAIQAEDFYTAIAFVEEGLGVAIMPRMAAQMASLISSSNIQMRPIKGPEPSRTLIALMRVTGPPNRAADRALQVLVEMTRAEEAASSQAEQAELTRTAYAETARATNADANTNAYASGVD